MCLFNIFRLDFWVKIVLEPVTTLTYLCIAAQALIFVVKKRLV